jgi:simple sugar transport system ATP-binding protein
MNTSEEYPSDHLLELRGMTRSFPGVLANDRVDLVLPPGQIHALLGENGAGKSTLVKMIYGILKPDTGELFWKGQRMDVVSPAFARNLGIAMVFQHFSLFDSLTVFENIVLGMDAREDGNALRRDIEEISRRYGLPLDPDRHVYTLSVGERQRIEIIRCLLQKPGLLVMDEPTSVLTPQEVDKLFETLRKLAAEGMSILYISHKLDEIKALCSHATILRGGRVVDSVAVADETTATLAAKMMGADLAAEPEPRPHAAGDVRLGLQHLSQPATDEFGIPLRDINLQVRSGEILGIAGVAGNGQDELLKAINGETLAPAGEVQIDGRDCGRLGPNARRMLGLSSIPEERLGHGAVPGVSLTGNGLLTAFVRLNLSSGGFIRWQACEKFAGEVIERFDVRSGGVQAPAASLSGGNLQKFIVGREICQDPELLVVSQPTWGVDAGAARTIHDALRTLADRGTAVLVISQDLDELLRLSDRVAAICAGSVSASYRVGDISVEQIGLLMAGAEQLDNLETADAV